MVKDKNEIPENFFNEDVLKKVFDEVNNTINKNILDKISETNKKTDKMKNTNMGGNTLDA